MSIETLVFDLISAVLIIASACVVLAKQPLHSILFLVLAFFAASGLWILLHAEFLALILVLVYVGAVMTLFLFVVMMLNLDIKPKEKYFTTYLLPGALFAVLMLATLIWAEKQPHFVASQALTTLNDANFSNTNALGMVLYTDYLLPFEMSAVILLVAIISAIMLTLRAPRRKKQDISTQIHMQHEKDIRIISMPSERKEDSP